MKYTPWEIRSFFEKYIQFQYLQWLDFAEGVISVHLLYQYSSFLRRTPLNSHKRGCTRLNENQWKVPLIFVLLFHVLLSIFAIHFIKIFPGMWRACSVNLYRIKNTVFLNKSVKNSYTTFTDISLYLYCNWVNDITWFQTKWIISRIKHGNKFFKRSYFTVLRVLLFETTKILMTLPFIVSVLEKQALFEN